MYGILEAPKARASAAVLQDYRYPIVLPARYRAEHKRTRYTQGTGETIAIGRSSVLFSTEQPLVTDLGISLMIDWPVRLGGQVQLQLQVRGKVRWTDHDRVLLHISTYEFRTRRRGLEPGTANL